MRDEELLTAGAIRAMGLFVPSEIGDDIRMRMTRRLDAGSETLHVQIEAFPVASVGHIEVQARFVSAGCGPACKPDRHYIQAPPDRAGHIDCPIVVGGPTQQ